MHVQPRPIFGAQHWIATWRRQEASGIEGSGIHEAFGGEFSEDPAALLGINRRYLDDIKQDLLAGLFTTALKKAQGTVGSVFEFFNYKLPL